MYDDLHLIAGLLDLQQLPDHLRVLLRAHAGIDLDDLPLVRAFAEIVARHVRLQRVGMRLVASDDHHERLHDWLVVVLRPVRERGLRVFVDKRAVVQLKAFQLFGVADVVRDVEALARRNRRLLHESVAHRLRKRIFVGDVPERNLLRTLHDPRRRRQLQAKDGLQLVDRRHPGLCAVAVRLVHKHHKVVASGKVVEIALAYRLNEPPYPRNLRLLVLRVKVSLVLRRQLGDVEDVDYDGILEEIVAQHALAGLISLASDDNRRIAGKRPYALKDILLRARRKVGYQLVVDREVRCYDDEVADSMRLVEIRDERAHEPRLAYARRKRKAERTEIAVEVLDGRANRLYRIKLRVDVGILLEKTGRGDLRQYFKRLRLRLAKAQVVLDVAENRKVLFHYSSSICSIFDSSFAIGRLATLRL